VEGPRSSGPTFRCRAGGGAGPGRIMGPELTVVAKHNRTFIALCNMQLGLARFKTRSIARFPCGQHCCVVVSRGPSSNAKPVSLAIS
jgi:hypothetical protein